MDDQRPTVDGSPKRMSWVLIDGEIHYIPLAPILGFLLLILFWSLEFCVLIIHFGSHGLLPTAEKVWVLSGVTALVTIYKLILRRKHKAYDKYIRTGSRLKLSNFHSWAVVSTVFCYLAFTVWIVAGC